MTSETADFVLARVLGSEITSCLLSLNQTNKAYYCGSDKNNDLFCDSANVSARHCFFICYQNEVYIKDLDSNNGIFVNGIQIKQLHQLKENDLIGIGTHRQRTNDSKKFIYRLQKQAQVVTERQCLEDQKQMLESKLDQEPSKLRKFSDINQNEHEKPSISRQSPIILDITSFDDDIYSITSDLSEASTIHNVNTDFNENINLVMTSDPLLDVKLGNSADIEELQLDEPDIMIIEDISPYSENVIVSNFCKTQDVTERQSSEVPKRMLEAKLYNQDQPSKFYKFSDIKQKEHEKPSISRQSPAIFNITNSDDDSNNIEILIKNNEIIIIDSESDATECPVDDLSDADTIFNDSIEETLTPVLDQKIYTSETISDKLISEILEWNSVNFQIRSTEKKCPILKCYESYEQYSKVLKSHLICNIAYKVKRGLAYINSEHSTLKKCDVVESTASKIKIAGADQLSLLNFYLYLEVEKSFKVPEIGDLVRLKITRNDIMSSSVIIGYINNSTTINFERDCSGIICTVTTKFLDFNIYTSTVLSLHVLTSLLPSLNTVQTIAEFQTSPLLPHILNPGIEKNFPPRDPLENVVLSPSSCLKPQIYIVSNDQVHAVMEVSKIIRKEEPKICIIEGPPGTGKTAVLIDTISSVMCTQEENISKPKILVCAKCRTEVDEIVSRLAFVKKKLEQGRNIKLVRIGDPDIDDTEVKKFTSQVQAKRHIELGKREFLLAEESRGGNECQKKLSLLHSDFDKLDIPSNSIKSHVIETCSEIVKSGRKVCEMSEEEHSKLLDFVENMILLEANVIVCTLSMQLANKLDAIYGKKEEISACIIDEATKIPEIEVLKPLTFGVKTLVLVGDPYLNKIINRHTTDNTLFSRIKTNYKELQNSPTFSLDLQYRINPNVVYWLNKIIYEEKMKSGFSTVQYPLLPYKVLNIFPYTIHFDEPLFVSTLISCIVKFAKIDRIIKPMTIGVILPNGALKPNVISAINTSLSMMSTERCDLFKIDVDTLSAFKNQERDVIIISCTKKLGNSEEPVEDEWLYAALTRVKHSLILYGTFRKKMKPSFLTSIVRTRTGKHRYFNVHDSTSASDLKNYIIRKSRTHSK